ncbi:MAG: glycosyltransferase [Candidatus Dormibacteraeota bacterium]|uniref:Glycosyltransferase n=1 Tax=Candidatus Amunia macphersoniae TaxID=3127014 RepID=A0A934NDZ6_9BACT|nr:glycosyltransferase [Candidatus Dormibacteraeota bacterium]
MDGEVEVGADRGATVLWPSRAESIPRVSVVIPTYNRALRLERLLRALHQCTMPPGGMEVIVVDDGSSDSTAAVAADADVTYLAQTNAGPAAAREVGWRSARGEIVVFLDDDVVPELDAVERLVSALDEADGVGAAILCLDETSLIANYMHVDGLVNHKVTEGTVLWLITAAAAFRRDALERVGGFDLDFPRAAGEDVDLSLRLLEAGCVLRLEPTALVRHDHHSSFAQLMGTCHRYGTAYTLLAARHVAHRRDRKRSALLRLSPTEWVRVFMGYRRVASVPRSLAFVGLHAFVGLPYALGILAGARAAATTSPRFTDLQIVGRAQAAAAVDAEPAAADQQVGREHAAPAA